MFEAVERPFLVPFNGEFHQPEAPTFVAKVADKKTYKKRLARNGTIILKFWLNVSREEQHKRFTPSTRNV